MAESSSCSRKASPWTRPSDRTPMRTILHGKDKALSQTSFPTPFLPNSQLPFPVHYSPFSQPAPRTPGRARARRSKFEVEVEVGGWRLDLAMAGLAMAASGVSQALGTHEGLRRVAPGVAAAAPARGVSLARRVCVQAIAEPVMKRERTIEECEADVVAGNAPAAPAVPAKARAPEGTPKISPLVMPARPRRNRRSPALRAAFQETTVSPANFILPLFVHEGEQNAPIGAMPGCQRLGWRHGLIDEVYKARDVGVNSVVLFPKVPDGLKTSCGSEAFNPDGLVPRCIRLLKDKFPDLVIYTDVALDPYSSDGHDGIVREDGVIMNDETVHQLCKQAVAQAQAGADVVSPSDMMDGRVGAIRNALDLAGYQDVSIMAYTAKYASAFYGPFREALDSNPRFGDKKTYQMNPANYREALIETRMDEAEGADILMVKPAMPYLDVIRLLRDNTSLPISAYQVSGEYSMIRAAAAAGMLDEKKAILESLLSIRRAGADVILTYFAIEAAQYLCAERF